MLENLTKSMFAENVNSTFHLRHGTGRPLALELVECREGVAQPDYEHFSLLFQGPRAVVLPRSEAHHYHGRYLSMEAAERAPLRRDLV